MVKPPKIRHSKSRKDPVTIDLEPGEMSRVADELRGDSDPSTVIDEQTAPASASGGTGHSDDVTDGSSRADVDTPAAETPVESGPAPAEEDISPPDADGAPHLVADEPEQAHAAPTSTIRDPEQPATGRPAAVQPRGRGSIVTAGLVGALAALLVAGGLQWAGLIGQPAADNSEAEALAAVRTEVGALRQQIDAGNASQPDAALQGEIEALRGEIAGLREAAGNQAGFDAVNSRIGEIDERLAALGEPDAASTEALDALSARVDGLETQLREAAAAAEAAGQRLGAIETTQTALGERIDAQDAQPRMAVAIAATALKSAVDRGQSFTTELETYAAVSPDAPGLDQLRQFADEGVATQAELSDLAGDAATAMIVAARPAEPEGGLFDRLSSSARSLIEVRPVGTPEGTDVPSVTARIEGAVKAGDYGRAITEFDTLPEAAKAAGASFIDQVRARQGADELLSRALADAIRAQAGGE